MQEKLNRTEPTGICHRIFTFIVNSLVGRLLVKQVTLGHPMPDQDEQPMIPAANPNGVETMDLHEARQTPEKDSGLQIQVHYKQTDDGFESWTHIDKLGDPVKANVSEHKGNLKKVLSIKDVPKPDKEKSSMKKGKGVMGSEKLTLAMEMEDDDKGSKIALRRRVRPLFHIAPNINEKSEAFIQSRKEAMRRNYGIEPRKS
ncbi:unnamed protein product [Malus baccata var. baccata]